MPGLCLEAPYHQHRLFKTRVMRGNKLRKMRQTREMNQINQSYDGNFIDTYYASI